MTRSSDETPLPMARGTTNSAASIVLLSACAALLLFLLPAPCHPGHEGVGAEEGIAAKKGRATTVAELANLWDSRHCGDCHAEIYRDWERSIHSRSLLGTGRTALTLLTALSNGIMKYPYSGATKPGEIRAEHLMVCAKCHLPQLADATDDVAREIVDDLLKWQDAVKTKNVRAAGKYEDKIKSLNIGCLICHNRNAVVHKWTDGYPKTREVYGSKEGPHFCGVFPKLRKSPVMGESVLCGQCHGLGPNLELDNPTQCATLYGNYLFSYMAEGGRETCQECHMRRSRLGHNIQSYRAPVMAKAAIDFQVGIQRLVPDDDRVSNPGPAQRIAVNVAMTNKAGHSIPDG